MPPQKTIASTPPTVARGPYQNGIRRRRAIILAASRIYAAHGFNSGTLRQIAREVGVTPAALARHCTSKEDLLLAVLQNWDTESRARNPHNIRGLAHFIGLRDSVIHNQANRQVIELYLTLSAEATHPSHPARAFIQQRFKTIVRSSVKLLQQAREAGEILPMDDATIVAEVHALYAMMDGIQMQWLINPKTDLVSIFSHALNATLERWTGRKNVLPPLGIKA